MPVPAVLESRLPSRSPLRLLVLLLLRLLRFLRFLLLLFFALVLLPPFVSHCLAPFGLLQPRLGCPTIHSFLAVCCPLRWQNILYTGFRRITAKLSGPVPANQVEVKRTHRPAMGPLERSVRRLPAARERRQCLSPRAKAQRSAARAGSACLPAGNRSGFSRHPSTR